MATGWKAGSFSQMQISVLLSTEVCDQAVIEFLEAAEVGKFPPK
jgi:hypothetical protein